MTNRRVAMTTASRDGLSQTRISLTRCGRMRHRTALCKWNTETTRGECMTCSTQALTGQTCFGKMIIVGTSHFISRHHSEGSLCTREHGCWTAFNVDVDSCLQCCECRVSGTHHTSIRTLTQPSQNRRYMLLYKRGGWWSDIDHGPYLRGMRGEPTIPLDQMAAIDGGVPPDTSLIIPRNIGFRWMVENHLIGAASGNPVLKLAIDTVLSNLRDHKIPAGHAHFAMTGPELFGNCINRCIDPKKTADMVPIKTGLPLGPGRCMNSTFFIMLTNWSGNFVSEHGPKVARRYQCEGRKKHPLLVPYGPRTIFRPENVTRTKIK